MSKTHIPEKTKIRLWGKAGGRCQYKGCNKPLYFDSLTKAEFNTAYIAHIIADSPEGPRGDKVLSTQLSSNIDNLMLMCDEHHRLIDKGDVDGHPTALLNQMKQNHEKRIEMVTSLDSDCQSHMILYGTNIGENTSPISFNKAIPALLPEKYPAEKPGIEIGLKNSSFYDNEDIFWCVEKENLNRQFTTQVVPKLKQGKIEHLSIFAIAPQPLLIELGRLVTDLQIADVYQLQREPSTWVWSSEPIINTKYKIIEPDKITDDIAINLSLSGNINNERITKILGEDTSIWTITIDEPNNDFLKHKEQLSSFRKQLRYLFNKIKTAHGENKLINVFPAVPVSAAVEIGRVWMPKSDLSLLIYDQNNKAKDFIKTFHIGEEI